MPVHDNGRIVTTLTVIRESGEVLGTVIVNDRGYFETEQESLDYRARIRRWLEERPSPDAEVMIFPAARVPEPADLNLILDRLLHAEQLYT